MSDVDMEESGSEQEEEEESPQPKRTKSGKKRKQNTKPPELPPFEYNESIEKITTIASDVKNGIKVRNKLEWKRIFPSLTKQVETTGLPEQILEDLWQIFSLPKLSLITCAQRREMIFLLIPDKLLPSSYIENMIKWLTIEVNAETNKSLHIPILKYIYGMVEYGLIDGHSLSKPFWYTNLLYLRINEDLIQWLFLILKKVTKKETVQRFYVITLLDLWKRAYKNANKKAIVDLLKLYKILRPDLMPDNVFNIRIVSAGNSTTKLSETFTKCLFETKRRIAGNTVQDDEGEIMDLGEDDSINPSMEPLINQFDKRKLTNTNFFPAMAPTYKDEISLKTALTSPSLTKLDKMLWALLDSSRLPSLLVDGEMIETFFSWLAINFNHHFGHYDPKQHHRYVFVLQKCIEVSILLDEGLAPVDDWLCEFLISWDMDLFRNQVLVLTSFFNITEFSERLVLILQKFEFDFLYGPINRSQEIWNMFHKLLLRWIKQARNSQLTAPDENRGAADSVERLFEFLNDLVTKFIALKFSTENCESMILLMCQTYHELSISYNVERLSFEPIPPVALLYTVILVDSVITLNSFVGIVNIIKDWNPTSKASKNRLRQINIKLSRYFGMGDLPSLTDLFEKENAADDSLDGPEHLSSILKTWSFDSSKLLEILQKNSTSNNSNNPDLDMNKVRKLAPNLAIYFRAKQSKKI